MEAERSKEAEEKEAALQRLAEMEPLAEEKASLESLAQGLSRQLEDARSGQQELQEELEELRRQIGDLGAENAALAASIVAAELQEKRLKVCSGSGESP